MATLQETLKHNPYKDIIIPIIEFSEQKYTSYEDKAAIAELLIQKLDFWGNSIPEALIEAGPERGQREVISRERLFSIPNKQTSKRPNGRNVIIEQTRQKLKSIDMAAPNAWVFYNQIIETFYAYVDFITYFAADYKDGAYINNVLASIGAIVREGASLTGLEVSVKRQGSDGPTPAVTGVIVDTVAGGDDGKYFTAYSDASNLEVVWFNVDGGGSTPVIAPITGVTINYVEVILSSGGTALEKRSLIRNAVNTAARMSAINGVGTDVIISTLTDGTFPDSVDQDIPTTGNWAYSFVNGTTDPIQAEITNVDLNSVLVLDLNNKYFTMWDGVRQYGFWFNIDSGSQPTDPSVTDWVQVSVLSTATKQELQEALNLAINTLGVWTIDNASVLSTDWLSPNDGPQTAPNPATATKGIANASTDLKGADDSVLASDLVTDQEYVDAWNDLKVAYDATLGVTTSYVVVAGLQPCGPPKLCNDNCENFCSRFVNDSQAYADCLANCRTNYASKLVDNSGILITGAFDMRFDVIGFNKPGTQFDVHASERGKAVL